MAGSCSPLIVRKLMRSTGGTPLHMCAMVGAEESIQLMLQFGVGTETRDVKGKTALMVGAEHGKVASLTCLLDGGALLNSLCTPDAGLAYSALTFACLRAATDAAQGEACVRLLLQRGAACSPCDLVVSQAYPALHALLLAAPRINE